MTKESFDFRLILPAEVADSGKSVVAVRRESSAVAYHMGHGIMKVYHKELAERVEVLDIGGNSADKGEF